MTIEIFKTSRKALDIFQAMCRHAKMIQLLSLTTLQPVLECTLDILENVAIL